jgi:glycosyltransferase involved in cell wall biosynthesis
MAARKPVIASAVGAIPEIVTNEESALLIQPGDPEQLQQAIERLLQDSALGERLAANAHRNVVGKHSSAHMAEQYIAIYEQATTEQATKSSAPSTVHGND